MDMSYLCPILSYMWLLDVILEGCGALVRIWFSICLAILNRGEFVGFILCDHPLKGYQIFRCHAWQHMCSRSLFMAKVGHGPS